MKPNFLHGILLAAGLVAVREVVISNNTHKSKKILDSKANPEPQPELEEEVFPVAFRKPPFTIEDREPLNSRQELIEKIKDYTVKLVFKKTYSYDTGTGWFLDHEIPVHPKKYPTKWFIATNARVVANYPFHGDPYDQGPKILKAHDTQDLYLYRWESGGYDEEILRGDGIDFEEPSARYSYAAQSHNLRHSFPPSRDVLTTENKDWHRRQETPSMHIKIPYPKLLYVAIDGKINDYHEKPFNSFLDFAVLEIDFPDETSARRMTEQIYYRSDNERMDFLGEVKKNSQLYTAGYHSDSFNQFRPFGNYSRTRNSASEREKCYSLSDKHTALLNWNEKEYRNERCYYRLNNLRSDKNTLGSMVVDEAGTLFGLHSGGDQLDKNGYTLPIRSKYLVCDQYCHINLEYDLITGSSLQRTSYKQQLLRYLPETNTYLKNKYKWGTNPLLQS